MADIELPERLYSDLHSLDERYAGLYLVNKFFIRITTGLKKADVASYDFETGNFSDEDQQKIQFDNLPTMYHEHIHYVHEVSTIAGINQFFLNIYNRSIFSEFLKLPETSEPVMITGEKRETYKKVKATLNACTGGSTLSLDDKIVLSVDKIEMYPFDAYEPLYKEDVPMKLPVVHYTFFDRLTGKQGHAELFFGKYFLYEGLAHHLDQVVTKKLKRAPTPKQLIHPDYIIMEMVAKFLFPAIGERSMQEIASLSLSYFNCGQLFVHMIKEAATVENIDGYIMELYNDICKHFDESEGEIMAMLNYIPELYQMRSGMHSAVTHLCDTMKRSFYKRKEYPTFEVDITHSNFLELKKIVPPCDMLLEFSDEDLFKRDFAGTNLSNLLASDLQVFLCHVDYFQAAESPLREHCCPLFTFCQHRLRLEKPEQCRTIPRLSFEDNEEYDWCHYSRGIAYYTGRDQN